MATKEIAVDGATITDDNVANSTTLTITAVPSTKAKIEGNGIYKKELGFTIASGSGISGSCVLTAPVNDKIPSTAVKTKAEGDEVMRKDDSVVVNATGTNPSSGASCPLVFNVRIDDAGQTSGKGA